MKCEDLLRMLNEYVDGEIDPSICDQFESHLEGCDPCQVVVDTVRRTITLYKDEQVYSIPIEFRLRLRDTLRDKWHAAGRQTSVGDNAPHEDVSRSATEDDDPSRTAPGRHDDSSAS